MILRKTIYHDSQFNPHSKKARRNIHIALLYKAREMIDGLSEAKSLIEQIVNPCRMARSRSHTKRATRHSGAATFVGCTSDRFGSKAVIAFEGNL